MQLINPRELYTFEEFFDTDIEKVSLTDMAASIQNVLREEFGITCNLDHASEIFDCEIEAHDDFVSCVCQETGNLYHYCLEVVNREGKFKFDLRPKKMRFFRAYVFRWSNTMELDNVKFIF